MSVPAVQQRVHAATTMAAITIAELVVEHLPPHPLAPPGYANERIHQTSMLQLGNRQLGMLSEVSKIRIPRD